MKLPSLEHILRRSSYTLKRFPLALISATIVAVTAACILEFSLEEADYLYNVILTAILGIPLFIVIQLISEKRGWNQVLAVLIKGVGLTILLLYYFLLPENYGHAPDYHFYRYALYLIGIHLLVAVGPFWDKGEMNAFWQYNKTLFLRFLMAVLFSGVLYLGLTVALLSTDALLGVNIEDETFFQLFALLAGIFNTWFFLAGIPKPVNYFSTVDGYPKGLKVFTQNILIPLVIIYLVILYLYTGKILIEWSWPQGWVANHIIGFSIVGILAILLLHPIQEKVENRWIKRFSRSYFWSLVPLTVLLLLAIWRRIWEYGFTVERYFVLISGLWLAGIVLYFTVSKVKNIKIIPASLLVIAFLISFGPWGAFSVSERSQVHRLQNFLQQNGILKKGSVQPAPAKVSFNSRQEISSITRYLVNTHGSDGLQPWFEQNLAGLMAEAEDSGSTRAFRQHEEPEQIVKLMGIEYVSEWESRDIDRKQTQFSSGSRNALPLEGFDWIIQQIYIKAEEPAKEISVGVRRLAIKPEPESLNMRIYFSNDSSSALTIDSGEMVNRLLQKYSSKNHNIPQEEMTVSSSNKNWTVKISFRRINWKEEGKKRILENAEFDLLVAFKAN